MFLNVFHWLSQCEKKRNMIESPLLEMSRNNYTTPTFSIYHLYTLYTHYYIICMFYSWRHIKHMVSIIEAIYTIHFITEQILCRRIVHYENSSHCSMYHWLTSFPQQNLYMHESLKQSRTCSIQIQHFVKFICVYRFIGSINACRTKQKLKTPCN